MDITAQDRSSGTFRRRMQMVYQDPYGSLDPRMRVRDIVGEPLAVHGLTHSRAEYNERVAALLATVGLLPDDGRALSARVLGRPAPAHRHRARARARAQPGDLRRAGVGARRVDPGAGDQRADGVAAAAEAVVPVRRARPGGGAPHQPPRRGDVPRAHRRDRRARGAVSRTAASVHAGVVVGGAGGRPGGRKAAPAPGAARRGAQRDAPAQRLPLSSTLPARDGGVQRAEPAAGHARRRARSGMPPARQGDDRAARGGRQP